MQLEHQTVPQIADPAFQSVTPSEGADSAANPSKAAVPVPVPEVPAYQPAAPLATQEGPLGIRFDFNEGCRVQVPLSDKPWRVKLTDLDTGNILFESTADFTGGTIASSKRYYIRFGVEVWSAGELVLHHEHDPRGRDVLVQLPVGTIGDTMGWFPYAVKFQARHGCRLTCAMGAKLIPLFQDAYPDITFIIHQAINAEQFYATYNIGLFFDDADNVFQPCDFRYVGLHRTAGYILGVDPTEVAPKLSYTDDSRPIAEPYVCIAVQASMQGKHWNNPEGWAAVIAFVKAQGYRVICIDEKPFTGQGLIWNHMPRGAEDQTGPRDLRERARWLKHCSLFIGLSSGLAWMGWAAGCPVLMISGFTHPLNEFHTPYRVINYHACNSCWNDPRVRFDHHDFLWCPRHKDTPRHYECTRLITAAHVIAVIATVPGFQAALPVNEGGKSRIKT